MSKTTPSDDVLVPIHTRLSRREADALERQRASYETAVGVDVSTAAYVRRLIVSDVAASAALEALHGGERAKAVGDQAKAAAPNVGQFGSTVGLAGQAIGRLNPALGQTVRKRAAK